MAKETRQDRISNEISLKPSQIYQAMKMADSIGDSMMVWGAPGIGKSMLAKQYANENYPLLKDNLVEIEKLKARVADKSDEYTQSQLDAFVATLIDQETNFIDFRLSQIEPTDLRGIPVPVKRYADEAGNVVFQHEMVEGQNYRESTSVEWAAPAALKLNANWKGVIMFDEINSAMPIVQAASYQLILDRCIGELKLPEGAFILAAGNRDTDGGVTFALATPLRDRMTHLTMKADLEDWVNNFAVKNRVHPRVVGYLKSADSHFNTLNPQDPSHAGGTSPRSWVRVSDFEYYRDQNPNTPREIVKAMISGRVGDAIGSTYLAYTENVADLPATMDILTGKVKDLAGRKLDISQNYFISLNLVYKIIDLNESKNSKELPMKEWSTLCGNFLEFIDKNFGEKHNKELVILSIRTLTENKCMIRAKEVARYESFVDKYADLVIKSRNI